jgi:hypothetical protein
VCGLRAKAQITELTRQLEIFNQSLAAVQEDLAATKLHLARRNCLVDQLYLCMVPDHLIGTKIKVFF